MRTRKPQGVDAATCGILRLLGCVWIAIFGDRMWLCNKKMKANFQVRQILRVCTRYFANLTSSFPTYAGQYIDKETSCSPAMETRSIVLSEIASLYSTS